MFAADCLQVLAAVGLPDDADDLFGRVSLRFHGRFLAFSGRNLSLDSDLFQGPQSSMASAPNLFMSTPTVANGSCRKPDNGEVSSTVVQREPKF